MTEQSFQDKIILITGATPGLGRVFALAAARTGANVVIHHEHSESDAKILQAEINELGRTAWIFQADLSDSSQVWDLIPFINRSTTIDLLINSATIFESLTLDTTSIEDWEKHIAISPTAPLLLSQSFARQADEGARIVNILDWRALRSEADHFPYTISKSALAGMTKSIATTLIKNVPLKRWAQMEEVGQALLFC